MLTVEQFKTLFPRAVDPEGFVAAMNELFPKYQINTKNRMAAFLAQCGHESGGWRLFSENLNYSAERLLQVFPRYFKSLEEAQKVGGKPQDIANIIYANRMGNGHPISGDGWKFRGRGPIQLTGKDNYTAFSKDMFGDDSIIKNPDQIVMDRKTCVLSAIWFWNKNGLNTFADQGDILTMTKRINGGIIGLEERKKNFEAALKVL